jgi:DAPG hydrolase PhiG domain
VTTGSEGTLMQFGLDHAAVLLDPGPLALEMGVQRLDSGVLHVAARTDMPRCKGRMFEWWFRFAPDTRQYAWWHPIDHVSSAWVETSPRTHVGSTHLVEERLGGEEVYALQIHFIDAAEIFGAEAVEAARAAGDVSAIVAAQIGIGEEPVRDERGRPNMGRMAHIARDTAEGMVLRSRFWLGAGLDAPPEQLRATIPDEIGLGLMRHAHTEFKYLARFLPSLYIAEQREEEPVDLPW